MVSASMIVPDSLGYDQFRGACRRRFQILAHFFIRLIVERGKAVVKNENFGFHSDGARDGKALFLSARYVFAALGNLRIVSLFHFTDKAVRLRRLRGFDDLFLRNIGIPDAMLSFTVPVNSTPFCGT